MRIGRKVFSNGFKLFDLLLMMVAFAVATVPLYERVGRFSIAQFFELRVKLGNLILFLSFLLIWHIVFRAFGLYTSKRLNGRWEEIWDITKATTMGTELIAIFGWAFHIWLVNRVFLAIFWLTTTVLVVLSRTMIRSSLAYARRHGRNTRNMLVIGTNARALQLVDRIQHKP
ncbi:MAG: hypothetical protein ACRD3B_04835, partial [Candidatus Sulfotelmatobacter sp.]